MKTKHANVGLLNVLFMPGASGTFLANMLSRAITDPWWNDFSAEPPNEVFKATQEYMNPYNQIVMTWHPFDIKDDDALYDTKDINWINMTVTDKETKFTDIMSAIKRQDYNGITKKDILDRLYATSNPHYERTQLRQVEVAKKLAVNNNVMDVKWSDVFVEGNTDVILSMINFLFKGQYKTLDVVENIADKCKAKHVADTHMYNELLYNPDKVIDNVLEVVDKVYQDSKEDID